MRAGWACRPPAPSAATADLRRHQPAAEDDDSGAPATPRAGGRCRGRRPARNHSARAGAGGRRAPRPGDRGPRRCDARTGDRGRSTLPSGGDSAAHGPFHGVTFGGSGPSRGGGFSPRRPTDAVKVDFRAAPTPEEQRTNWTWRAVCVPGGPAVVFDIDGVLSDAAGRQHFIEHGRRDWHAFFEACGDDPVIEEIARLLELLDPTLDVILLTGRPQRVQPQTLAWLERYGLRWDLLVMRAGGLRAGHVLQATVVRTCGPTASICDWRSRTIPRTTPCTSRQASPASTSTPAITSSGAGGPDKPLTGASSSRLASTATGIELRPREPVGSRLSTPSKG